MKVIRGLHNIQASDKGAWISIGNFDGLHLGHHAIVKQLQAQAAKSQALTMIINFHPSPDTYFHPQQAKAKLTKLREKIRILDTWGVDKLLILPFNAKLAALSASDFISDILISRLGMKGIVVGDDFHFGHKRQGDIALLNHEAKRLSYACLALTSQVQDSERISSTRIRQALAEGDFVLAERLLGRPYSLEGRVSRGQMRGRLLGFPTANIALGKGVSPLLGVFAGWVLLPDNTEVPAVANIGWRPTVGGTKAPLLEIHLLDFNGELYEQRLRFTPVRKLRNEQKFEGLEALQAQLNADIVLARQVLAAMRITS